MKRLFTILSIIIISSISYGESSYTFIAKIESVREDNHITIISAEELTRKEYSIIHDKEIVGKIILISRLTAMTGRNRYIARAEFQTNSKVRLVAGLNVGLRVIEKAKKMTFKDKYYKEVVNLKKVIISPLDKRKMVLVDGGKFVYGSNNGSPDEYPQTFDSIDDFYIDKYEVSNGDYQRFIKATNGKKPLSWEGGIFPEKDSNKPVMVTYYEAQKYARWCGKRLPTEKEWEKAANGKKKLVGVVTPDGYLHIIESTIYPWGDRFNPDNCNSMENKKIKKKGLMPVDSFEKRGNSAFGVVNMSGNAAEWTSSWYRPYEGNRYKHKRFGKQVKVIKGGSWYDSRDKLRISNREIGGIPNLYEDNIAGFRCVRDANENDVKK